ncbi:Calpain-like protease palB, partial [Frankliniella fusca]
ANRPDPDRHVRLREYTDMFAVYVECDRNAARAARVYAARYAARWHPGYRVFQRVQNYLANPVVNVVRPRPRDVHVQEVTAYFDQFPHARKYLAVLRSRDTSGDLGLSRRMVGRILKDEAYHPYKIVLTQGLTPADHGARMQYCNWLVDRPDPVAFASRVLWTDEANFNNKANVNRHNCHYWARENPHWMRAVDHQVIWGVNCWGGVLGNN